MKQLITPEKHPTTRLVKTELDCTTALASELKTLAVLLLVSGLLTGETRRSNLSSSKYASVDLFLSEKRYRGDSPCLVEGPVFLPGKSGYHLVVVLWFLVGCTVWYRHHST